MGDAREASAEEVEEPTWDDDGFYELSFGVHKSRRYHAFMREFYKRCHDLTLALTAASGSAAFVSLLPANPNAWIPRILAAIVAISSTLDLVFDFSKKADRHDSLCGRFTELAAHLHEEPATLDALERARAARIRIEADEPTERRIVELWAHNDECRARGVEIERLVPLSWLQRTALMYLVRTWDEAGLERRIVKQRKRLAAKDALVSAT